MGRGSCSLIACLFAGSFLTPAALAQDSAAASAEATNDDNVIIVTATKRAQDVQDVPIAVTALSPAQLENQGVVDITNIAQVSPSFTTSQAQNSFGTVVLRLRGIGTISNNIGFESAVGVFIDGAYQSRAGVALSEFVDIERVEVLRGPQGTLFGRNTSAGALSVTTKRPDLDEFSGFANATYGNYDHFNLQGGFNVPLVENTLAARLTGAYRKRDGFITLVDANGAKFGEDNTADQWLLRGQVGWESPSGFRGRVIADYSRSEGTCCAVIETLSSPIETLGFFDLVGLGERGGMAGPVVATDPTDARSARTAGENRVSSVNRQHLAEVDNFGITAELEYPLSDLVDLVYVGSYREYESVEDYDSDFSALDIFNIDSTGFTEIETMTHELRVQGEALDGRLDWLVGGYYSKEDIVQQADASLGVDYGEFAGAFLAFATSGVSGPDGLFYTAAANGLAGLDPANPLTFLSSGGAFGAGANPDNTSSSNLFSQSSKSWSLFTHNTLAITDSLSATVGLRWSDEKKEGGLDQLAIDNDTCSGFLQNGIANIGAVAAAAGVAPGDLPPTLVPFSFVLSCLPFTAPAIGSDAIPLPLPREFQGEFRDEELIYTGNLAYDFGDFNAYASFTHGYKAGGFILDVTAAAGGANPEFASEEVDAFEIGLKGRFFDDVLTANVALFHQEFENFQILEFTGTQFVVFNVPKVVSKGFEIESQLRPAAGLTINAALTYSDAGYPSDCASASDALRVQNLCGSALNAAPKFVTILGVDYRTDISNDLSLFFNGQVRTSSKYRTYIQPSTPPASAAALGNTPLNPFDFQESTAMINLRAGVGDADDKWVLEAWVTNLTNEVHRPLSLPIPLRIGSAGSFTQEPRMYGVTVRSKF